MTNVIPWFVAAAAIFSIFEADLAICSAFISVPTNFQSVFYNPQRYMNVCQ